MSVEDIYKKIAEQMKGDAPAGWKELKMRCHYYDDAMEIKTYYREATEERWSSYDCGDFELMDLCEELAEATFPSMDDEWTKLILLVISDGSIEYEYGYGDPGIFDS